MANRYCKNFFTKTCVAPRHPLDEEDFIYIKDADAGIIESEVCRHCDERAIREVALVELTPEEEAKIHCGTCVFNILLQLVDDIEEVTEAQEAYAARVFIRLRQQESGGLLDDPQLVKSLRGN